MTLWEARRCLERLLIEQEGRFQFANAKAVLVVRTSDALVAFRAADHVGFQLDEQSLAIVEVRSGLVRRRFAWQHIERIAVGEPETSNSALFQG